MLFSIFHVLGLVFLVRYHKVRVSIVQYVLVALILGVYYFTLKDSSFTAMLIYSWAVYFVTCFILIKKPHMSYHMSIIVIVVGVFLNAVISREPFHYYIYLYSFNLEHLVIAIAHILTLVALLILFRRLSFYKDHLYASRFTFVNVFIHFQIVMVHIIHDFDLIDLYVSGVDAYYYQRLVSSSFVFYILLVISAIFYENKRTEEEKLFSLIKHKRDDLQYLFDTKPSKLIQELKQLGQEEQYEKVLEKTQSYMGYRKKLSHKRVLDKLDDELLAYVTMEVISKHKDVAFEVVVESVPRVTFSKLHYFLEIYGIVIDNAVEAAKKAQFRYVKVVFDQNVVLIENSYLEDDVLNLVEKTSNDGHENRINGLKLLDYLEEESTINIHTEVSYRVAVRIEVDHA